MAEKPNSTNDAGENLLDALRRFMGAQVQVEEDLEDMPMAMHVKPVRPKLAKAIMKKSTT